ncbi:MAG: hypothetical protein ABI716_00395 [Candidatus Saccharibacteria bacterium]
MNKLSQILAVGVMTVTPFLAGSSASALGSCAIGYTGPDSNNQCISTTSFECTVTNNTDVTIVNDNTQFTVSGNAGTTGNTTAGSTSTGTATNSNGVTFNATVTNGATPSLSTCSVVASVPATNPGGGGNGAVAGPVIQAVPAPGGNGALAGNGAVALLPDTSSDPVMTYVSSLVGILGIAAVASRLAVMTYGRIKS